MRSAPSGRGAALYRGGALAESRLVGCKGAARALPTTGFPAAARVGRRVRRGVARDAGAGRLWVALPIVSVLARSAGVELRGHGFLAAGAPGELDLRDPLRPPRAWTDIASRSTRTRRAPPRSCTPRLPADVRCCSPTCRRCSGRRRLQRLGTSSVAVGRQARLQSPAPIRGGSWLADPPVEGCRSGAEPRGTARERRVCTSLGPA